MQETLEKRAVKEEELCSTYQDYHSSGDMPEKCSKCLGKKNGCALYEAIGRTSVFGESISYKRKVYK